MASAQASPTVTIGERRAKKWNDNQQRAVFYASLGLMLASITSIRWACALIGFPAPAAWLVAVAFELLVAIIGDAASSTRRTNDDGSKGGYYGSLWAIFTFMLLLAMTANVGHAVFTMGEAFTAGGMPAFLMDYQGEVMGLGSAFAAAVPLGGTFGFHVSGFLRKYGAGADWVDENGAKQTTVSAPEPRVRRRKDPATAAAAVQAPRPTVRATVPNPAPERPAPPAGQDQVQDQGAESRKSDKANVLGEEQVYELIKQALDAGDDHRLKASGDLSGTSIGKLIGLSRTQGSRMRKRCISRYLAESDNDIPGWLMQLVADDVKDKDG
ncbi:hypothetical protein GTY75_08635 [Streptomyces sp. SID8381]|uniref:hypothetical protein n=1 Tax=unclassified Streptomyces TaxID=2593676 RepID=UPI00035EC875|nr:MULTISPECIES: hypothetical protein [unclassified Streptomyces]MYX26734.1 hypothetical protein [Streptomyces sp. SID8381]